MLDLSDVQNMSIEEMQAIDIDDLVFARFYYEEPSTQEKILAEGITADVLYRNKVDRCGFDCVHMDSVECFYENYKEALMFYVMAYVDGSEGTRNRIYTRPIKNAIEIGKVNV